MQRIATILLLLLSLASTGRAGNADYQLDVTISLDDYSMQGTGRIALESLPADGRLTLQRELNQSTTLALNGIFINGQPVDYSLEGPHYRLDLNRFAAPLVLEVEWSLPQLPESGGIILLDDFRGSSWFPRVRETEAAEFDVTLSLMGSGKVATNGVTRSSEELGGMSEYHITARRSLILAVSPIFVEQRTFAEGTSLGVFMREGADSWKGRVAANAAEIIGFYQQQIPGFAPEQIDIVFVGSELVSDIAVPGMVIIADNIDQYVDEYGSVFTANHLRWELATRLAGAWFAMQIQLPESGIPWLSRGLAYFYAQEYAHEVLLGGPAFDTIKQRYLSALESDADLSLEQNISQAGALLETLADSKGFWVAGMLRSEIGGPAFRQFVRSIVNSEGPLTLDAIEQLASDAAGEDLSSFFDTWVRGDQRFDLAIREAGQTESGVALEVTNPLATPVTMAVQLGLVTGNELRRQVTLQPGTHALTLEAEASIRRIRFDPDRDYPDPVRSNNVRSFGSTKAIEQLYAIDNQFIIGDLEVTGKPVKAGNRRAVDFQISITNRSENRAYLGIHLTTSFPGVRNRGISRIFIQLAGNETQTIDDILFMPLRGRGAMEVKVEYFIVAGREQFEAITRRTSPNLVSWFMVPVE